jgi:ABC-2 type transport system permease protein
MKRALLLPFWRGSRNRFWPPGVFPFRSLALGLFGLLICLALYLISVRTITYFHAQNELGVILSLKLLQMAWLMLFAMLVFSCMVSAVSALYLAKDNEIVFAAPVSAADLYFMRYVTTTIYTSWMMMAFSIPVFGAYGRVFEAGPWFWPLLLLCAVAIPLSATGIGMALTVVLVNVFPARRTKDIIVYLSLCFGIFIYVVFRMLRPEEMVDPERFGQFIDYLSAISRPTSAILPPSWAAGLLSGYLLDREIDWLLVALVLQTPLALYIMGEWAMGRWFAPGFSKSQESFGGFHGFSKAGPYRPGVWRWLLIKESKVFLRDSTEWSQLFMIAALIVVYLYNFTVLPVERAPMPTEYLTNIISFLNIGLVAFMTASLAARFVYPSIAGEGPAFYLIAAAPLSARAFLLAKLAIYLLPFTLFSLLLVLVSDHLLQISGPMWWFSLACSQLLCWWIVALAVGFGALYGDFNAESRAAAVGGLGAILFLFTAMTIVVIITGAGAGPMYALTRAWLAGRDLPLKSVLGLVAWGGGSLAAAIASSTWLLNKGARKLSGQM